MLCGCKEEIGVCCGGVVGNILGCTVERRGVSYLGVLCIEVKLIGVYCVAVKEKLLCVVQCRRKLVVVLYICCFIKGKIICKSWL